MTAKPETRVVAGVRAAGAALAALALAACGSGAGAPGPRQLDLIFVIDDSGSMDEEQRSLHRGFSALVGALRDGAGDLPDTRVAIISSNYGAGPGVPAFGCPLRGDGGRFQVRAGCGLEGQAYLSIDGAGNQNFQGDLPAVFGCLSALGVAGCNYEHPLQSLRAALAATDPGSSAAPGNRGFLREQAVVGIVILGNEDDCSGEVDATFYEGPIEGQGASLRCALLGHVCDGQPVVASKGYRAPLASCEPYRRQPGERTSRLIDVQELAAAVRTVKGGDEDRIVVSSIVGWDSSPQAVYGLQERPSVYGGVEVDAQAVCTHAAIGSATPAVRLVGFTRSFRRHTVHPICDPDLGPAMKRIGDELARAIDRDR